MILSDSARAHLGTATDTVRGRLVAQTGSRLFRRMVFGRWADCQSIANPRNSRLPVCATVAVPRCAHSVLAGG